MPVKEFFNRLLTQFDTLDLWPWLGPRWKRQASPALIVPAYNTASAWFGPITAIVSSIGILIALRMGNTLPGIIVPALGHLTQVVFDRYCSEEVTGGGQVQATALNPEVDGQLRSICTQKHFSEALSSCMAIRWSILAAGVIKLLFIATPAFASAIMFGTWHWMSLLIAMLVGMLIPVAAAWSRGGVDSLAVRSRGVTSTYISESERHMKRLDVRPPSFLLGEDADCLDSFSITEQQRIKRWATVNVSPVGGGIRRPWLRKKDYVFISYAWGDRSAARVSADVALVLKELDVAYYRSEESAQSRFMNWREQIATELMSCTHLFLIVSRQTAQAATTRRELLTAFQRWYLEMLPSIACIVEPSVYNTLINDPNVALEFRFALVWCPKLTFPEAADANCIETLIRQRRRQGRWLDLATTLASSAGARQQVTRRASF